MIWFETNGTVWRVEDKGNYARINLSTSRKDKETGEYQNSGWFANVVGKAYEFVQGVERGEFVHMKGHISNERYQDESGNLLNPRTPSIMIYDMSYYDGSERDNIDSPPRVVTDSEPGAKKSTKALPKKSAKVQPSNDEFDDDDDLPF